MGLILFLRQSSNRGWKYYGTKMNAFSGSQEINIVYHRKQDMSSHHKKNERFHMQVFILSHSCFLSQILKPFVLPTSTTFHELRITPWLKF